MLRGSSATDELEAGLGEASWIVYLTIYSWTFFAFGAQHYFPPEWGIQTHAPSYGHPSWAPTGSLKYFLLIFSHIHLWCHPPLRKGFLHYGIMSPLHNEQCFTHTKVGKGGVSYIFSFLFIRNVQYSLPSYQKEKRQSLALSCWNLVCWGYTDTKPPECQKYKVSSVREIRK